MEAWWVVAAVKEASIGMGNGNWFKIEGVSNVFTDRFDIVGNGGVESRDTVSFYFSDFPSSHGAKEMLKAFALYGRVVEVVIPPKTNKWEKRFGFVRFAEVREPIVFAVKFDNIIYGADNIHVNLPRFEREKHDEKEKNERKRKEQEAVPRMGIHKVWKEVLRGKGGGNEKDETSERKEKSALQEDNRGRAHVKRRGGGEGCYADRANARGRWNTGLHL